MSVKKNFGKKNIEISYFILLSAKKLNCSYQLIRMLQRWNLYENSVPKSEILQK